MLKDRAYKQGGACGNEVICCQVIVKLSDQLYSCVANQEASSCLALKQLQQEVENLRVRRTHTQTRASLNAFPVHRDMGMMVNSQSKKTGTLCVSPG